MSNSGSSAEGKRIAVHTHFEEIRTRGKLDFSEGWRLGQGKVGVTRSGTPWERVGSSFLLPNGWVATSDNGRIGVRISPEQFFGRWGAAAQPVPFPEIAQQAERLTTDRYFGNHASTPDSDGDDASSGLGRFESSRTGASGPVPYFGLTKAAQRLYANVPASSFPAFPSWVNPGGASGPVNLQSPNVSPAPLVPEKSSAVPGGTAWASFDATPLAPDGFESNSAEATGATTPAIDENFRYLARSTARKPQASVFDTGAPAPPFVRPDGEGFGAGLPGLRAAGLTRGALRNPSQSLPRRAGSATTRTR